MDPNFVPAYKAAKAGGIPKVDAYMFPCKHSPFIFQKKEKGLLTVQGTGTQPTGVACKSPQTQINELLNVISANNINVEYIWFDVEPTSGVCNAWNLSPSANLAAAKNWVSLLRATGLKWGIYGNG